MFRVMQKDVGTCKSGAECVSGVCRGGFCYKEKEPSEKEKICKRKYLTDPRKCCKRVFAKQCLGICKNYRESRACEDNLTKKTIALVIGNNAYEDRGIPTLANAKHGAEDVTKKFLDMGIDVLKCIDCRLDELIEKEGEFMEKIKPGVVAVVYYAGHGVERNTRNYLLPVDMPNIKGKKRQAQADALKRKAWDIREHEELIIDKNPDFYVIILDACRNDPFAKSRSAKSQGLKPLEPADLRGVVMGGVVMYATMSGKEADDNVGGRNGLFTERFLMHLKPGVPIKTILQETKYDVILATETEQVPEIKENFYKRGSENIPFATHYSNEL